MLKVLFALCFAFWLFLVTGAAIVIMEDGWGVLVIWAILTFSPIMSLIIQALGKLLLRPEGV